MPPLLLCSEPMLLDLEVSRGRQMTDMQVLALQVLPVWDCWLQDEGANRILQVLTAALQQRRGNEELPSLSPFTKVNSSSPA